MKNQNEEITEKAESPHAGDRVIPLGIQQVNLIPGIYRLVWK
jgi:hypothetical protein